MSCPPSLFASPEIYCLLRLSSLIQPGYIPLLLFPFFTMATINIDICLYCISQALNVPYCLLTSILTQMQRALWDFYVVTRFYYVRVEAFMQSGEASLPRVPVFTAESKDKLTTTDMLTTSPKSGQDAKRRWKENREQNSDRALTWLLRPPPCQISPRQGFQSGL